MSSTTPAIPDDAAPRGHAAFKALLQRGKSRLADLVRLVAWAACSACSVCSVCSGTCLLGGQMDLVELAPS